ncbi:MAG: alpha/beta hydrolase [Elusimicrobia bacterium]|nr:alpha/beta hydrolase [Elusimicrobiota bacterium]
MNGPTASPLVYAVLIAVLVSAGATKLQRAFLYHPDRTIAAAPKDLGLSHRSVWFSTVDRVRIHAWLIEGEEGKPIILFFHDKGTNISKRLAKAGELSRMGYSVFLFDYRGFGLSQGNPYERGTYRDAEAAYFHLHHTWEYDPSRILFYGEGLGCGVATEMALRHGPSALILEGPFTSVADLASRRFPRLPAASFLVDRYANLRKIRHIRSPLLVLHSREDEDVPFEMGRRIFEAAPEPKRFVELTGTHEMAFRASQETYRRALGPFLSMSSARALNRP